MSVGLICGWEKCRYEAQNLVKAFFPGEQFLPDAAGDVTVYIEVEQGALPLVKAVVRGAEGEYSASEQAAQNAYLSAPDLDMALGRAVFRILSQYTGRQLPWGILTGVRPVKLFLGLSAELGEAEAERVFREQLYVTPQKTDLVRRTAHGQHRAVGDCFDNQCSLYISIPFCPTRCAYCSFVSQDNDKCGDKLVKPYLELLHREIGHTLDFIRHSGKTLKSIYIGGGTPAVLSAEQLGRLIELLNTAGKTDEFTVELGRPDAITREKLQVARELGVDRVSINPQTTSDGVLQAIGRKHTTAQFYEAMNAARSVGWDNINCDLIIGLPTDTPQGFEKSLRELIGLGAENITVHSYSVKRASTLATSGAAGQLISAATDCDPHDFADRALTAAGYEPYYLYRQKDILGGNENVGWCLDGKYGLYNLYMMNELHSVYSCGAGGVSKAVSADGRSIERCFNLKLPLEYIRRFDEVLQRKQQLFDEEMR